MRRSYFFLIVIVGGILAVLTTLFFVFDNPYRRLNPEPTPVVTAPTLDDQLPPSAGEATDTELITVLELPTIGLTTGVDGLRLVFYDKDSSKIEVTEFDGTGLQELSDTLLGVEAMELSPAKDKAWMRLTDPETKDLITLVYDFRAKEAVRLENGIKAIDWSPDGSELLYYVDRSGSAPALKRVKANGVEPRTVRQGFTVQNPVLAWYAEDQLAYWLSPSSTRPSSIITMNLSGNNAVELAATAPAAQALFSPDGTYALLAQNNPTTGKPQLALSTTADRTTSALPLTTWLDKCTWMNDSARILCFVPRDLPGNFVYPESDTGANAYRDQLWVIDAATAKPQLIYDVPGSITDATKPFASTNGSRLNFISRASGTVVSLELADKLVAPTTPNASTNLITPAGATTAPGTSSSSGGSGSGTGSLPTGSSTSGSGTTY
ncbi:MAG: hypothetical protein U0517_03860 [Candidatus Andersenbacteria bacterium]